VAALANAQLYIREMGGSRLDFLFIWEGYATFDATFHGEGCNFSWRKMQLFMEKVQLFLMQLFMEKVQLFLMQLFMEKVLRT